MIRFYSRSTFYRFICHVKRSNTIVDSIHGLEKVRGLRKSESRFISSSSSMLSSFGSKQNKFSSVFQEIKNKYNPDVTLQVKSESSSSKAINEQNNSKQPLESELDLSPPSSSALENISTSSLFTNSTKKINKSNKFSSMFQSLKSDTSVDDVIRSQTEQSKSLDTTKTNISTTSVKNVTSNFTSIFQSLKINNNNSDGNNNSQSESVISSSLPKSEPIENLPSNNSTSSSTISTDKPKKLVSIFQSLKNQSSRSNTSQANQSQTTNIQSSKNNSQGKKKFPLHSPSSVSSNDPSQPFVLSNLDMNSTINSSISTDRLVSKDRLASNIIPDRASRQAIKEKFSINVLPNSKTSVSSSSSSQSPITGSIRDILAKKMKNASSGVVNNNNTSSSSDSTDNLHSKQSNEEIKEEDIAPNLRSMNEDILKGLSKVSSEQDIYSTEIAKDVNVPSDGELRYQEYQDRIKRKREMLAKEIPSVPKPSKFRRVVNNKSGSKTTKNSKSSNNSGNVNKNIDTSTDNGIYTGKLEFNQNNVENLSIERNMTTTDEVVEEQFNEEGNEEEEGRRRNEEEENGEENDTLKSTKPLSVAELKKLTQERIQSQKIPSPEELKTLEKPNKKYSSKSKKKSFKKTQKNSTPVVPIVQKHIILPFSGLSLKDYASLLGMKQGDLKHRLADVIQLSGDENESFMIDTDSCELIALELGHTVSHEVSKADMDVIKARISASRTKPPEPRLPVVCVMGHVDHGKTTLLDALRKTNIASLEAGGITQKLSAFTVPVGDKKVVFLDTPGHAAFSTMRSSGVEATDIIVLVVAIDDGVQPQTREAVAVALKAKRTIIVALNKIDMIPKPDRPAARARVLNEIAALDIIPEDFGGETQVVEISARTREGLDVLVESLAVQSEVMELVASSSGYVQATVLGASLDKGLGAVVDVLVREGTVSVGDFVVIGTTYGKVKSIYNDSGKSIKSAGPSTPIRITGVKDVPSAGDVMLGMETENQARQIAEARHRIEELGKLNKSISNPVPSLVVSPNRNLAVADDTPTNEKLINLILKADSVGTLDALLKVIISFSARTTDVRVNIVDASVGNISSSDVDRAFTVKGGTMMILGFNVNIANQSTKNRIKDTGIKVAKDNVIYRLEDELKLAMEQSLTEERVLTLQGTAIVQKVFTMNDKTKAVIAGLRVKSGNIKVPPPESKVQYIYRVVRNGQIVQDNLIAKSLKKFKDSVTEVSFGQECGLDLEEYKDYEEGDDIECYKVDWITPKLRLSEPIVFKSLDSINTEIQQKL